MKYFLLLFIVSLIGTSNLSAEDEILSEDKINEWLPTLLGTSNAGQEYYFAFHPAWETNSDAENMLKVYIACGVEAAVTVRVEGKGFEETQKTVPNGIICFDIPPAIGMVYRKSDRDIPHEDQVWSKYAVHVKADAPVICYALCRYQYTSDGFMAIPATSLGKEYVVSSWTDIGSNNVSGGQFLTSYSSAIAPFDNTKVRYTGGGPSFSKTTTGIGVGDSKTFDLNSGDVLMMASLGRFSDLSGSSFVSNKPIAVVSGNYCSYVPENVPACDYMIEQEIPVFAWAKEYHVTPIQNRLKHSIIKVYAKEDATTIYRDGEEIAFLPKGMGGALDEAYIYIRADDESNKPRPIIISGDKPISVTQYNTGQIDDGVLSDPFQLTLIPMEQFQEEIIFNTPGVNGYGFIENYVNIVYAADADGLPKDFEIAEVIDGKFQWIPLTAYSPNPGVEFKGNNKLFCKTITLTRDGIYKLRNSTPFGAYSYGFGPYDSYAYPAYASLGIPGGIDLEPPQFAELAFDENGNVITKESGSKEIIISDGESGSNISKVILDPYLSSNFKISTQEYLPGEDAEVTMTANVINPDREGRLVIRVTDKAGNTATQSLDYKPQSISPEISCNSSIDFVINDPDMEYRKSISIKNLGDADLEIQSISGLNTRNHHNDKLVFNCNEIVQELVNGPIIIAPDKEYSFDVVFEGNPHENYQDFIQFNTNSTEGNNICNLTATSLVSVEEATSSLGFSFSPNPTTGILNITSSGVNDVIQKIEIFDSNGKTVMQENSINRTSSSINLTNKVNGTYIVVVSTMNSKYYKKITLIK